MPTQPEGTLPPDKAPHPTDAHRCEGRCRFPFCPGYPRAGLLTLVGTNRAGEPETWIKPIVTTNARRDTIEACAACAEEFGRTMPDKAAFRSMPTGHLRPRQ